MQRLVEGIHRFQESITTKRRRFFERLVEAQQPLALFITCSDSRIVPNLLTRTKPGELFILRNAGNIVPPHGIVVGGEAATVEFAVAELNIKDIVVCGHSHCGAMRALLCPDELKARKLTAVQAWLNHAEATRRILEENYQHLDDPDARMKVAVQENVLVQLEHLRTHPSVAAGLARKDLNLHGWVYKFETGQVFAYDSREEQFLPLNGRRPMDGPHLEDGIGTVGAATV